jgi:hypothetical protein
MRCAARWPSKTSFRFQIFWKVKKSRSSILQLKPPFCSTCFPCLPSLPLVGPHRPCLSLAPEGRCVGVEGVDAVRTSTTRGSAPSLCRHRPTVRAAYAALRRLCRPAAPPPCSSSAPANLSSVALGPTPRPSLAAAAASLPVAIPRSPAAPRSVALTRSAMPQPDRRARESRRTRRARDHSSMLPTGIPPYLSLGAHWMTQAPV